MANEFKFDGLLGDPMVQMGLGILSNNGVSRMPHNFGQTLSRGMLQGMSNASQFRQQQQDNDLKKQKASMDKAQFDLHQQQLQRQLDAQAKRDPAMARLLAGDSSYQTTQETPVTSYQNMPTPAQDGAQAPNFATTSQPFTTMQQTSVMDNAKRMQDYVDAGFGDDLIKRQLSKSEPIKLGKGDRLYDPVSYKELVSAAQDPESLPNDVREYKFAVSQGYKGDFRTYQLEGKRAGAASTTVSYGSPVAGVDANGNPVFFQPSKNGGAPSIVAGVKPEPKPAKAPTDSQAKAGTFHSQMVNASRALSDLSNEGTYDPTSIGGQIGVGLASGVTNSLASPSSQRARQAQNQWAESFLRIKTGAAATKDEVSMNVETFFPKVGDSSEVIAQKAKMRQNAENDVLSMTNNPSNILPTDSRMDAKPAVKNQPKSKAFKLDGGGSVFGILGNDGNYYVTKGGKKYKVAE